MSDQLLKDDPSVTLPPAVRAAAARSKAAFESQVNIDGQSISEFQAPVSPPEPVIEQGVVVTPLGNEPSIGENPEPAPSEDEGTWEHKYKSMHGRFLRSQEQLKGMSEEIRGLQQVIASMPVTPQTSELPELPTESLLSEEDINDYGADLLKVIGKKARDEVAPLLKAHQQEIAKLQAQLASVDGKQQVRQADDLNSQLDKALPNWGQVNTDPNFLAWLSLPDPYSGAIRYEMLNAAYSQGNARRVLAFFNGFLAEEAAMAPASAEPDLGATTVPKIPLASLAAPGRAKAAASTPAPDEKPLITRAQIQSFYADVAARKYLGREAEKDRLEAMIIAASNEGRIR